MGNQFPAISHLPTHPRALLRRAAGQLQRAAPSLTVRPICMLPVAHGDYKPVRQSLMKKQTTRAMRTACLGTHEVNASLPFFLRQGVTILQHPKMSVVHMVGTDTAHN